MSEHDLGQFLTDDERETLAVKRQQSIAKTLLSHAQLLYQLGIPTETIQPSVDTMRSRLESQSSDEIKKIRKALLDAANKLPDLPLEEMVGSSTLEQPNPVEREEDGAAESVEEIVEVEISNPEAEQPALQEETGQPVEIDETKPKKLPPQLNHLFGRVLTFEQRDAIMTLGSGQKVALENVVHKIIIEHGHHGQRNIAASHMQKFRMLLEGKNAEQIARELDMSPSNISSPFRNSLRQLMFQNKHEVAQAYADILTMEPDVEATLQDAAIEAPVKPKHGETVRPEGLSVHIDNLFLNTLTFDQRAAIPEFTKAQRAELSSMLDTVLATHYPDQNAKDIQIARFEKIMNGVSVKEIADQEGNVHFFAITQQFRKSLPSILKPHKDEISEEFDKIVHLAKDEQAVVTLSSESLVENDQPSPDVNEEMIAAEAKFDTVEIESLVEKMRLIYQTDDEEAIKGITELFSVKSGVIPSSEQSVEAARYFSMLVASKKISIDMAIANPGPRGVVNRLLNGVDTPEGKKQYTLSEILAEKPDASRDSTREAVERALEKIAKQLEGVTPAKQDILEDRIRLISQELGKVLPNSETEIIDQIVLMARDKPVVSTIELNKALRDLYREGKKREDALPDFGLTILHGFALPGPTGSPMSITEIKNSLMRRDSDNKSAYENGFVSDNLLQTLERLIEMAGE